MNFQGTLAVLATATATVPVGAGFVGMEVENSSTVQGGNTYFVFKVYAKFNNANDTVLNCFGMSAAPAGLFWHNDFLTGGAFSNAAGTWSPTLIPAGNAAFDSWVTIGGTAGDFGNSTSADPQWGGPGFNQAGIPANAGWFNSIPSNLQGRVNPTTLRTQIAQFVMRDQITSWTTPISILFNQGLGLPIQPVHASFTLVPAPNALAVLALTGLTRDRRRA